MQYKTRTTWKNHLGNQRIDPLRIYRPESIADVQAIVRDARESKVTVRAVGSGHSWSDVALTDGFLLRTDGLARVPAPEPDFVRPEWTAAGRRLVRAEGGTRIRELNAWLDAHGMGLSNMGGYDHQTIAGVTATSTHGSGIEFGPLNDALRSLDVVVGDGSVQRIEPTDGPTDRAAFEAHHGDARTLVQEDHVFDAVCVGMGCMGVICTAMVEVRERFFMREVRKLQPWAEVKAELLDGVVHSSEHYEIAFSPYDDGYAYPCLVTTRDPVSDPRNRRWSIRTRNPLVEVASKMPFTPHVINVLLDIRPSLAPKLLLAALRALVKKRYDHVSYKVFNIGNANLMPAYSCEVGVPMVDNLHIEAVEAILRIARERRDLGRVYQSSPIALRFVKASPAHLSMMNGGDTMMIELIGLNGNDGGIELLKAYEEALYALGGRPHWGHINTLSGSHGFVESMYDSSYAAWMDVRARLDPDGVFDSPFTRRVGLSSEHFDASGWVTARGVSARRRPS